MYVHKTTNISIVIMIIMVNTFSLLKLVDQCFALG